MEGNLFETIMDGKALTRELIVSHRYSFKRQNYDLQCL
jgi:hypothetical protein